MASFWFDIFDGDFIFWRCGESHGRYRLRAELVQVERVCLPYDLVFSYVECFVAPFLSIKAIEALF